ncbi:hypothetical protein E4U42_001420 [Claviceps africana]|uniref:Uncharacterized protein n=1 Tax=Claviceps africana TaxID=83212 RepID=A0A8K0J4G5_9HYPO|nr:hypothetical protein E4U42_001420 [Claviceps africana]
MELRLVEARRFVRTTYRRTADVADTVAGIRVETADPRNDYVDGILFSRDHGVVVTGTMTDDLPADQAVRTFSRARDPWFYLHVRDRTRHLPPAATTFDYIPLAEYLFRYDRAAFWVGAQGWTYFKYVPFNRFTRWLLDDFMHTRMLYRALHASGESSRFVVQDLALPFANAEAFIDYTAEAFDIWPLWLCPLRQTLPPTFHPYTGETEPETETEPASETETGSGSAAPVPKDMLNIGLWGWGPPDHDDFVAKNRALEDKLVQLGGRKWLYAHTYYDHDDFWRVYDDNRDWYDALRRKYHATTLPTVHDKVRIDVDAARAERAKVRQSLKTKWPVGGLYGIWQAIRSRDYLLHRRAQWKYKHGP